MEYAMDSSMIDGMASKKTSSDSATTYKLTNVSGLYRWLLPPATVTSTYFSAVDVTGTAGSVALKYGDSTAAATKYDDDVAAIAKWETSKTAYSTSMGTYVTEKKNTLVPTPMSLLRSGMISLERPEKRPNLLLL